MTKLLKEILGMSVAERILLVEAIWDSIAIESENVNLDASQKKLIKSRLKSFKNNSDDVLTWSQIRSSLPK